MTAGERLIVNSPTKPEARKTPPMMLARLVVNPRRLGCADSKSMTAVPVNSPPSENPEAIRATRKIAGTRWPAVLSARDLLPSSPVP